MNGDDDRNYTITTGPRRRVSAVRSGVPAAPTVEIETDCATFTRIADAENATAAFGTAYENGEVAVRGTTLRHTVLVEVVELGVRIGRLLGVV